jgi:hypothetical protein
MMCGDLEEDDTEAQRLYARFLQVAHEAIHEAMEHRGGSRAALAEKAGEGDTIADEALHRYMDGLFSDILNACIKDSGRLDEGARYRVLALQSVVLARLAGFFAGQLDLRSDPLRTSMEALMAGYSAEPGGHDH